MHATYFGLKKKGGMPIYKQQYKNQRRTVLITKQF